MRSWCISFLLVSIPLLAEKTAAEKAQSTCVTAQMVGQLGNNLFQIATASALAWDNGAEPYFLEPFHFSKPQPQLLKHLLFRCKILPSDRKLDFQWYEPSFAYHPIPFHPNMKINGYFQSEKYFAHHRQKLLELFAPHPEDLRYIKKKYNWLIKRRNTVGVQIRYYKSEDPESGMYPQYGKEYLKKAMALFPKSSLFVISSNNLEYARNNIPEGIQNVVFLEGEPNYIDLFLLSLCKHNIITNSTFGWWAAWLNKNPNKMVVRPVVFLYGLPTEDVCPNQWIKIDAEPDREKYAM